MGAFRVKVPPHIGFLLLAVAIFLCLPALALPLAIAPTRHLTRWQRAWRMAAKIFVIAAALGLAVWYAVTHIEW